MKDAGYRIGHAISHLLTTEEKDMILSGDIPPRLQNRIKKHYTDTVRSVVESHYKEIGKEKASEEIEVKTQRVVENIFPQIYDGIIEGVVEVCGVV